MSNQHEMPRSAHSSSAPLCLIRPGRGWVSLQLPELWQFRELLSFFIVREVKVRYKQTMLGVAWAVIQPFMMMVIFSLFFGRFIDLPSQGIPYPLFSYAALLPWTLFVEGVSRSSNSVVVDGNLIRKVYFPRLIMPLSGAVTPLVDFFFSFLVFLGMMLYFGVVPTWRLIFLPFFLLMAVASSLSVGLWCAAVNVLYRDVRYVIPFLLQVWFFASPVVYASANLPQSWQFFYNLNPMVAVIEGFRWMLLGAQPPGMMILLSGSIMLVLLVGGLFYFRRMERIFADVV